MTTRKQEIIGKIEKVTRSANIYKGKYGNEALVQELYDLFLSECRDMIPDNGEDGLRLDTFKEGYKCGFNKVIEELRNALEDLEK